MIQLDAEGYIIKTESSASTCRTLDPEDYDMSDIHRRLNRLEVVWSAPAPRCPACQESPIREVVVDADTNEMLSESVPLMGCSLCGHRPFREILIVVDHADVASA